MDLKTINNKLINVVYQQKIKRFNVALVEHCQKNNIACSLKDFLYDQWNGFCSPAYTYLFLLPVCYMVCSKMINDYYMKLDKDFRDDLVYNYDLVAQGVRNDLMNNLELKQLLQKELGNDFIE